jgi:hypothetical protein
VFHHRLFAVTSVQVLTVSRPMETGQREKAASTLEAHASALVELLRAVDLERLQSAEYSITPARLYRQAYPRSDGSDKHQLT